MKFQPSTNCVKLIQKFEGFRSEAYLCPAEVWTIGYGTTVYPVGCRVMPGERCSAGEADVYLMHDLLTFADGIAFYIKQELNQNQIDALLSFAYNLGVSALLKSTLLKKVNANPDDKSISAEFFKWINADGKKQSGLINRRNAEALLYFKPAA